MKQFFYIFTFLTFLGCTNGTLVEVPENEEGNIVKKISIVCHQPKTAGNANTITNDQTTDDGLIIIKDFDENSLIYISQMGPSESTNPNFSDLTEDANPYCYIYQYSENENADWDNDYNFILPEDLVIGGSDQIRKAIDWNTIKSIGSVGNAFSLFAFYFPIENEVRWGVEPDQTGGTVDPYDRTNFMKSDIMGAYHATSALNTRLRFNLFHLMVYLKVTLYVPVYKENNVELTDFKYSGFHAGALRGAYVMNASTNFNVEWRANRSSDTDAPLTQADASSKTNIKMYVHPYDEEVITLENIKSGYYPSYAGEDVDQVRVYNFSVLFPNQTFNGNFLCFALQDEEGNMRYYYFAGNQITGDSGNYSLTQGTLQELKLYLPRTTNQTILIGANVLPWSDAMTDMTVSQQGSGSGQGDD